MSVIEGVSREVNDKMDAVSATMCAEDGMLFRLCEHGVRHPVGHLHRRLIQEDHARRHYVDVLGWIAFHKHVRCDCGCCAIWNPEPLPKCIFHHQAD